LPSLDVRRRRPALSFVNFYILIFFSKTTGPTGTKLGMNVHWMVPFKVYVFCWSEVHKRNKRAKVVKKCVSICTCINYLLFIWFWWEFCLMYFLRKSLLETWIALLCSYYWFWHKRGQNRGWGL